MSTTQIERTEQVISGQPEPQIHIHAHARAMARKLDAVKAATASLETEVNDSTLVVEALLIMAQALGEIRTIIEEPTS